LFLGLFNDVLALLSLLKKDKWLDYYN